jgi:signal transduction histidine kinase
MADKVHPSSHDYDGDETPQGLRIGDDPTETIDLGSLFTRDVTESGSFDLSGGIWATTFGKMIQALPIPALVIDQAYDVVVANQACGKISPHYEAIQGRPFFNLFPNESVRSKIRAILKQVFVTRKPHISQGTLQIDTSRIWGRMTFRSMRIIDDRSILVLVEDLTTEKQLIRLSHKYQEDLEKRVRERTAELKQINEQLQTEIRERHKAEEMLIQTERLRAVGEMAAGVAHNFNNLLQMVMAATQSALRYGESGNVSEIMGHLHQILRSSEHGSETVKRLQGFARLSSDVCHDKGTVFDLRLLAEQAIEMTKPWWKNDPERKGVDVRLTEDLQERCYVKGHESQIFEVLVNLIKNSAEAVSCGGEIHVRCAAYETEVALEVRDTGVGISEKDLGRLFTPFFTTKSETGTGLGLATSRSIVDNHGGRMTVHSTEGLGSTFSVFLPLSPQSAGNRKRFGGEQKSDTPLTILVVDDMEATVTTLKAGLESFSHRVLTALSGEQAFEIFLHNRVDLVICDLAMPGMNGWQVGKRVKEFCKQKGLPKPPFIIFTAWANQSEEDEKIMESGVDTVIEKPVDFPRLLEVIRDLV